MPWSAAVARRLAGTSAHVTVFCQRIGTHEPPANLDAVQIPFARVATRPLLRWLSIRAARARLRRLIEARSFDACFVHMAAHWAVLLEPELRRAEIPTLVWYAHGAVTPMLQEVLRASTRIVTSSPDGFRIASEKVFCIGQGVDTEIFRPSEGAPAGRTDVIAVSRLSPSKRHERLLEAFSLLAGRAVDSSIRLRIIGGAPSLSDRAYGRGLRRKAARMGLGPRVAFDGVLPQGDIASAHRRAFVHVNLSSTGSMDKTVLEALACGCPVVTSNAAYRGFFPPDSAGGWIERDDPEFVAERLRAAWERRSRVPDPALRALVVNRHDEATWVASVRRHLEEIAG